MGLSIITSSPRFGKPVALMKGYTPKLQRHLGDYASNRLGVEQRGDYRGKPYYHILPTSLADLNLLETYRTELRRYLGERKEIKRHKYFHHLNSSQAFAFNLFFPWFREGGTAARVLSKALGVDANVDKWAFEYVPDPREGTNVDVSWTTDDGRHVFCEVKLSESEFGSAKNDEEHRRKLQNIYSPALAGQVADELLEPKRFFAHYQLLRNLSLIAANASDELVFLFPRENESLAAPLARVLDATKAGLRDRVHVAYVEDCIESLTGNAGLSPRLRHHAAALCEKYLPVS